MNDETSLVHITQSPLATIGHIANEYAAQNAFSTYQKRIAANTQRRQKNDLDSFSAYLKQAGVTIETQDLLENPDAWHDVTHGLVDGFRLWLLQEGYAIGSVNIRLATVKVYCRLASRAGQLPPEEYALIKMVESYSHKEGRNIDQHREQTRKGVKKANAVPISKEQASTLKSQPDTPQGKRDALLMCLLLDHGLRCGEIADLKPEHFNLTDGTLIFYREKVDKTQTHKLTEDTLQAVKRYFEAHTPEKTLLAGSRKGGKLQGSMSRRAITLRANTLGKRVGLEPLSAHDGRHAWATFASRNGTNIKSLQQAGGWKSFSMPARYIEDNAIANEGVKL